VLVAAAVCPHPPLLVPEAAGMAGRRDAPEDPGSPVAAIGRLRAECAAALAVVLAARPDLLVVVGGADRTGSYPASAAGSLGRYGIPFVTGTGEPILPLSLTVGAWLLRGQPGRPPPRIRLQAVCQALPAAGCMRLGARLAHEAPAVGLLVMGDGPARRATGVHGAADPAADGYDAAVAAALAAAEPAGLASLDASLDAELLVAGRAAWQVLAGAAEGRRLRGNLRFAGAPLDVGYAVATWSDPACAPPDATQPGPDS